MRRAATSANALRLPPSEASTSLGVVRGRQEVIRLAGIFFTSIAGKRRSVYAQLDGEIVLADTCECATDWQPEFIVTRSISCPIDQHRMRAIQETGE
jgi:hypothetical protein